MWIRKNCACSGDCLGRFLRWAFNWFLKALTVETVTTPAGKSFHIFITLWLKVKLRRLSLDRSFLSFRECPRSLEVSDIGWVFFILVLRQSQHNSKGTSRVLIWLVVLRPSPLRYSRNWSCLFFHFTHAYSSPYDDYLHQLTRPPMDGLTPYLFTFFFTNSHPRKRDDIVDSSCVSMKHNPRLRHGTAWNHVIGMCCLRNQSLDHICIIFRF